MLQLAENTQIQSQISCFVNPFLNQTINSSQQCIQFYCGFRHCFSSSKRCEFSRAAATLSLSASCLFTKKNNNSTMKSPWDNKDTYTCHSLINTSLHQATSLSRSVSTKSFQQGFFDVRKLWGSMAFSFRVVRITGANILS